jgi:hypothetical protein
MSEIEIPEIQSHTRTPKVGIETAIRSFIYTIHMGSSPTAGPGIVTIFVNIHLLSFRNYSTPKNEVNRDEQGALHCDSKY